MTFNKIVLSVMLGVWSVTSLAGEFMMLPATVKCEDFHCVPCDNKGQCYSDPHLFNIHGVDGVYTFTNVFILKPLNGTATSAVGTYNGKTPHGLLVDLVVSSQSNLIDYNQTMVQNFNFKADTPYPNLSTCVGSPEDCRLVLR
jgi:hypothetical protein